MSGRYQEGFVNGHRKGMADCEPEIERLRAALKECADELAEYVEHHYAKTKDYPSEKRRYDRDIAPVIEARKLLALATA